MLMNRRSETGADDNEEGIRPDSTSDIVLRDRIRSAMEVTRSRQRSTTRPYHYRHHPMTARKSTNYMPNITVVLNNAPSRSGSKLLRKDPKDDVSSKTNRTYPAGCRPDFKLPFPGRSDDKDDDDDDKPGPSRRSPPTTGLSQMSLDVGDN